MATKLLYVSIWAAGIAAQGFGKECDSLRLQGSWLVGNCLTGTGSTRITSSSFLTSKIANIESKLTWQPKSTWNGYHDSSIDLAEHIDNYNGHLLSNLTGAPTIPDGSSSVPVPADMTWSLAYGQTSCYTDDPAICQPDQPVEIPSDCSSSPTWVSTFPQACNSFAWPVAIPVWVSFQSLNAGSPSNGWEFKVYDDPECKGELLQTITGAEANKCYKFPKYAVGVSIMPLWNGDI